MVSNTGPVKSSVIRIFGCFYYSKPEDKKDNSMFWEWSCPTMTVLLKDQSIYTYIIHVYLILFYHNRLKGTN